MRDDEPGYLMTLIFIALCIGGLASGYIAMALYQSTTYP